MKRSLTLYVKSGSYQVTAKTEDRQLTGKQKLFVRWYTTAGETFFNGTLSAAKARGRSTGANADAVYAYDSLRKPHIKRAIRAAMNEQFSAADLTIERVLHDIETVRTLAIKSGDLSNALKASEMHGKYLKMFVERIEHNYTIEDESTETLLALAQSLAGKIDGFNIDANAGTGAKAGTGSRTDSQGTETTH